MKLLNYTLAVVAGAFVAYVAIRPGVNAGDGDVTEPARVVVKKPVVTPSGPSPAELDKLEKENAELAVQLTEARTQLAEREAVLVRTKEALDELRRPMTEDILSSSLRAEMKSGEAIVTGGYRLPDGKRLYAFATPVVHQAEDGTQEVKIGFQMLRVTDEQGESVGLGTLATNAANTLQHGEVWIADEYAEVLQKLKATPGMAGTSVSPDLTVRFGSSGVIDTGDFKLKVTPERSGERDGLNVELRLEQPSVTPSPQEPVSPAGS